MYIRQEIKFSSRNHVVAVLFICKMQVSVENRYNSTLDEQTFCKGKICYFLKCTKQCHEYHQNLVLVVLGIIRVQFCRCKNFRCSFIPNWMTDLCSFVMLKLNNIFNFSSFSNVKKCFASEKSDQDTVSATIFQL